MDAPENRIRFDPDYPEPDVVTCGGARGYLVVREDGTVHFEPQYNKMEEPR